jgi:hypothetical protein
MRFLASPQLLIGLKIPHAAHIARIGNYLISLYTKKAEKSLDCS